MIQNIARLERQPKVAERSHQARYSLVSSTLKPDHHVLDVFCGTGYGSRIMAKAGAKVTAFDVHPNVSVPGISFHTGSFPVIGFCEGTFTHITCFEAIEHVDRLLGQRLLAEMFTWLRPMGTLWLSTPNGERVRFSEKRFPYHKLHYTHLELDMLLKRTGFESITWLSQPSKGNVSFNPGPDGDILVAKCRKSG